MCTAPRWTQHERELWPGCLPPGPALTAPFGPDGASCMASGYAASFEGQGEVKEGFLCPLCLKDLQSFYQLQDHYEGEHSGEERDVKGQLKSELRHGAPFRHWAASTT